MRDLQIQGGNWDLTIINGTDDSSYDGEQDKLFKKFLGGLSARSLTFLLTDMSPRTIARFLRLTEYGQPVALLDPNTQAEALKNLLDIYRPEFVFAVPGKEYDAFQGEYVIGEDVPGQWVRRTPAKIDLHPDLGVMLTTSGSTGSPKFVRLSLDNLFVSARQISQSLKIGRTDTVAATLPLFYSFGMSVVTSHALSGARIVVTTKSIIESGFWEDIRKNRVTSLPGVPQTYSMLRRIGFDEMAVPSLRVLTQAGGALSLDDTEYFHKSMTKRGGQFFVMYGQTEASPRISCLPSENVLRKIGSAGLPMMGSTISVHDEEGRQLEANDVGLVRYTGPNVMMGYAENSSDLALGDTFGFTLETGDLGFLDEEGFLFLKGRSKRITKIAGARISLDELEIIAGRIIGYSAAAVDSGQNGPYIFFVADDVEVDLDAARKKLARELRVPPKLLTVALLASLPLLPNGKTDYVTLAQSVEG